jgi:hypothetical protein
MPPPGRENGRRLEMKASEKSLDCANLAFETVQIMIVAMIVARN